MVGKLGYGLIENDGTNYLIDGDDVGVLIGD